MFNSKVATLDGWLDPTESAMDTTSIGSAPVQDSSMANLAFFVVFALITRVLFPVGLTFLASDERDRLVKKGSNDDDSMPEDEKVLDAALKKAEKGKLKRFPQTKNPVLGWLAKTVTGRAFEWMMMLLVFLNMVRQDTVKQKKCELTCTNSTSSSVICAYVAVPGFRKM